jgi:hypothetical protein
MTSERLGPPGQATLQLAHESLAVSRPPDAIMLGFPPAGARSTTRVISSVPEARATHLPES